MPNPTTPARPAPGTKLPCYVFDSVRDLARHVAHQIASTIRQRNTLGKSAVLGLPTGSTPVSVYRELIRMHREEELDFANVVTFNVDEYYGLAADASQSYHRWMHESFFKHVNIPPHNTHIPDGNVPMESVDEHCRDYERAIEAAGGLDLLLLGIGRNGHIGLNEPFSGRKSRTRLCRLDPVTRMAAASDFYGEENVPTHALTMGMATMLGAKRILLIALGEHKSAVIRETAEGPVTERVPASFLQEHPDATLVVDSAAANRLTGCATPWLMGNLEWTDAMIKRAVLWLGDQTGKALLKLDDEDFRSHNLHWLLRHRGASSELAHRVFRWMMNTIEYHPAGQEPKPILCFSPHPDDDVISMGGTLIRLNEDRHETHIAYMTSGNIAVFDHDARRVADLVTEYNRLFGIDQEKSQQVESTVNETLARKVAGQLDDDVVLRIKGLIRWSEAKAAAVGVGCREEHLHFLDLPFYRTGTVAKRPICEEDVTIIRELIERVAPKQIYVAGDLSDPHGTHRLCAEAIFRALDQLRQRTGSHPEVLLYRGAWEEYDLHEIELAVPLSPRDLQTKKNAIFMHESQKDEALFPGTDPREFWQRAEDRNKSTADKYNKIGLPEYYAMEAFVRWRGTPI